MYIQTTRRRLLRNGVLGRVACSRDAWAYHRRYIQIVHNNASIPSKVLQKKHINFDKVASLKFDPSDDLTDFTSFGILPFFQEKLNKLLLPRHNSVTSAPDYNVPPTPDQRTLLSILNSEHSLIHRGSSQTGKSLALLIYALNHTLSKVPNFGSLKNTKSQQSIDSIILAPTDLLIGKYEFYAKELTKDIPEMCCPDKLLADASQNDYSVTRKPLTVKFLYSDGTSKELCSSNNSEYSSDTPQMLITTPSRLYEIMNEGKSVGNITKENLNEVRFFAIDETDFLLNTTNISNVNNSNLVKSGKKSKYVNKIEKVIRQLQTSQVEYYSSNLYRRLKHVEYLHRSANQEAFAGNKFDHAKFIFEDNTLSTSSVSINIEQLVNGSSTTAKPDESLLKKLIKVKRKVLYKPIQYCFIFHSKHSYQQILLQLSNKKYKKAIDESIMKELQKIHNSRSDDKLQQEYSKFLLEKATRNDQKQEDSQVNFIEKLIRFDDSKRFYRKQERKIVSVGSFNLDNTTLNVSNENSGNKLSCPTDKVQTYFIEARNKRRNHKEIMLRDVEIAKNLPEKENILAVLEKDVENSGNNIKNLTKDFLKYRILSTSTLSKTDRINNQLCVTEIARETILKFRIEYPLDTNPILIVVPPFIDVGLLSNELNKDKLSHDKFTNLNSNEFTTVSEDTTPGFDYLALQNYFLKQSPKEHDFRTNIIVYPYQLIGQNISGLTNLIVIGMESLLPQLAFGSKDMATNDIAGIEDPISDLSSFYLSKMPSLSNSKVRNLLFVLNACNRNNSKCFQSRISNDFRRLSQIILYNELHERIQLTKICEEQPAFTELAYGIDKSFYQRIRNDINKHVYK
ncbi:uncharacterized protein AC631_01483 [Debaryomyces fabryi]|uniref:ATP-dependent RNA helicase n=1 Tax=Debaryomyces fabryi TaxID=58627 RepID=A0A0V1Q2M5_9ASCO|nr:uncharacterized protein AC631_01483 [Debaryomyces fabryi]KSA02779.1 hypothetical protein AC631_01483 [Debaryomyces fabryi]CUM56140.1 unnamed protein product [Debaryomyces fabryi]